MEEVTSMVADLTRQCKELEQHNALLEVELARKQAFWQELGLIMAEDQEEHERAIRATRRKLRRLKRRLAERQRFADAQREAAQGRVVLDVGGTRFTTTLSTLGDSVLAALFYGRQDLDETVDDDGAVFIDRDPQAFAHILQWLRTGVVPLVHDAAQRKTLILEAVHYGLDQLTSELELQAKHEEEVDNEKQKQQKKKRRGKSRRKVGWVKVTNAQFLDLVNRPPHGGLKFNGCDLRGFDFHAMHLRRANFHRCDLTGVDLRHAKLNGACLVECCLRDANLSGAQPFPAVAHIHLRC